MVGMTGAARTTVSRVLDLARTTVYRGGFRRFVVDHGLDRRLIELYWAVYRIGAEPDRPVRVGGATAVFSVSTYAEHHVVNAAEGAERPVISHILEALRPDDVFWDVGANIGTFSCLAGDVLSAGTVVAFEPYPPNVEKLRRNLEDNDVEAIVEPCALSDAPGDGTLFVLDTEDPGTLQGSIDSTYAALDAAVGSIGVEIASGDRLFSDGEIPAPNVVKVDVEGAAPAVLDGMAETLRNPSCRLVVVEPHDNRADIEQRLLEAGFRVEGVRLVGHRSEKPPTIVAHDSSSG